MKNIRDIYDKNNDMKRKKKTKKKIKKLKLIDL